MRIWPDIIESRNKVTSSGTCFIIIIYHSTPHTHTPLLFAVIWFPVGLYLRSGSGELSERDYPIESASGESYVRQCGGGVASLVAGYMWFPIARRFELCRKRRVYKPLPEGDLINLEGLIGNVGYILKKAEQVLFYLEW